MTEDSVCAGIWGLADVSWILLREGETRLGVYWLIFKRLAVGSREFRILGLQGRLYFRVLLILAGGMTATRKARKTKRQRS